MFTTDAQTAETVSFDTVKRYITQHETENGRLSKLLRYYRGEHDILKRKKEDATAPNSRLVCNHAKEIADTAVGYFVGNPITYNGDGADVLREWFAAADIDSVDMALAKNMGIYGRGYELICMSDEESPTPKSYSVDPRGAFVVYDDTVEHRPLFGVYYFPTFDPDGHPKGFKITLYTKTEEVHYETASGLESAAETRRIPNRFGLVPLVEYENNEEQQGDFEQVISLIDAYNLLMSDRVNDKEQFVDAILLLINSMLGDTDEEITEARERLLRNKMLELPSESDARYLTRTFDESGVEILKKALEQDIHKFANVPCLSDENFAGNSSGVAMEYKLLGIEMITKIKERCFKRGLKRRAELYSVIAGLKGRPVTGTLEPVFTRGLPKNLTEIATIVSQLQGMVPEEMLLALLPFVKDPKAALALLKEEKEEKLQQSFAAFGAQPNEPPEDDVHAE